MNDKNTQLDNKPQLATLIDANFLATAERQIINLLLWQYKQTLSPYQQKKRPLFTALQTLTLIIGLLGSLLGLGLTLLSLLFDKQLQVWGICDSVLLAIFTTSLVVFIVLFNLMANKTQLGTPKTPWLLKKAIIFSAKKMSKQAVQMVPFQATYSFRETQFRETQISYKRIRQNSNDKENDKESVIAWQKPLSAYFLVDNHVALGFSSATATTPQMVILHNHARQLIQVLKNHNSHIYQPTP